MAKRLGDEIKITIRIQKGLYEQLKKTAVKETDGNVSMAIRQAIREYVDYHRI